jgi:hyperosmotically inducible periplasmic protein
MSPTYNRSQLPPPTIYQRRNRIQEFYLARGQHMNIRRIFSLCLVIGAAFLISTSIASAGRESSQQGQQPAPDNTKTNQGDANKGAQTADQQKMNPADRETSKQIRSAIMKDKSLSTYAHNIKIITQNGKVTLKGPVRSDDEKANIAAKATAVAGAGNVENDLTVAPKAE